MSRFARSSDPDTFKAMCDLYIHHQADMASRVVLEEMIDACIEVTHENGSPEGTLLACCGTFEDAVRTAFVQLEINRLRKVAGQ